jgi:dTDP-4-amino-4,6-dideoxygalactose transaminase
VSRRWLTVWPPPLSPAVYGRSGDSAVPYPLGEPDARLFAWGRQALWHGVRAVGLGPGDTVLVPAYHHGSEVEALARAGLRCRFYGGGQDFGPRADELESLLDESVRALHLTHYLGFPQDLARWRQWCDSRGLLLIEDAAQAWLSHRDGRPVGSLGDVAIWCLYKSLALPEGALLRCARAPEARALDPRIGVAAVARQHAAWVAQRVPPATLALQAVQRRRAARRSSGGVDIALRDPEAGVWRSLPFLLRRVVDDSIAAQRRANYADIAARLPAPISAPFRELPAGASPFGLPIEVDDKGHVLDVLRHRGIQATNFWSVAHPSLPEADFPEVARARRCTVLLPVHQELRASDRDAIVAAVRAAGPLTPAGPRPGSATRGGGGEGAARPRDRARGGRGRRPGRAGPAARRA